MLTHEAEHLLEALRNGDITAADISGEQFQAIIFQKLIERCGSHDEFQYELLDNYRGAVDFVVREKPSQISQFHAEFPIHVFECKYYRRTLELSTVAKLLIVGVRFQPSSLNIVSGTSLQPQVYEYARLLFNGLGNDTAMFQRTFFRHYRTSDLFDLEIEHDRSLEKHGTLLDKNGTGNTLDISWEVSELRPFSVKVLAASSKNTAPVKLNGQWNYRIDLSLTLTKKAKDIKFWIDGIPKAAQRNLPKIISTVLQKGRYHFRFIQIIDPKALESDGYLALHLTLGSISHHVFTLPFTVSPSSGHPHSYHELRQKEIDRLTNLFAKRAAPRVIFLKGEAGVGKTYLCEMIAGNLQAAGDFDINRFSVNPTNDSSLLHEMLITVCTPAAARDDKANEWHQLASSILTALSPVSESSENTRLNSQPVEILIPVLAELLIRTGPRLIIIRDGHLLPEAVARQIDTLLMRLDDLGWGDVFCVLESRTLGAAVNPHWVNLEAGLLARINQSLQYDLDPITIGELNALLDSLFIHIPYELKEAIWNICGGIPLYLFSFLDLLESEKAIERKDGGDWIINSPSAFVKATKTKRRADGVLKDQLKSIQWDGTSGSARSMQDPLVLIGLLAICRETPRVKRLCQLANLAPEILHSIRRTLLSHRIIRPNSDGWTFDFKHDLMRMAAIDLGNGQESAPRIVEQILTAFKEKESNVLDLELCADLAAWVGFGEDAARFLNAAFEQLRKSDNYVLICRILGKLSKKLELASTTSQKNYAEYLTCRSALAWATWNTGSLTEARAEYARIAADSISASSRSIDSTVAEAFSADAERRVLGIDLALNDIPGFIASAHRALDLNGDSVVFNSIMNRLILYCARLNHVDLGLELSALLLKNFGDTEAESSGAVICSDIGALFRSSAHNDALELYRRGVQLAADSRQRSHNELDVFVTEAMSGITNPQPDEMDAWRRRLVDNGLRSMLRRFDMFSAARAIQEGQIERAQRLYQLIETSDAVYRGDPFRLDLLNDRMIACFVGDNLDEVDRQYELILKKISSILDERHIAFDRLKDLWPAIERQRDRFPHLAPIELTLPSARPAYSGLLIGVLFNMEAFARKRGRVKRSGLSDIDKLWPSDIDRSEAKIVFSKQPQAGLVDHKGEYFALCAQ